MPDDGKGLVSGDKTRDNDFWWRDDNHVGGVRSYGMGSLYIFAMTCLTPNYEASRVGNRASGEIEREGRISMFDLGPRRR